MIEEGSHTEWQQIKHHREYNVVLENAIAQCIVALAGKDVARVLRTHIEKPLFRHGVLVPLAEADYLVINDA